MNYVDVENFLRNGSFVLLFITFLFYWIKTAFFTNLNTSKFEITLLVGSNLLITTLLLIRWVESKHFPLSNLYESLLFLCWGLLLLLVTFQIILKENYIGILISPIIFFINTFATFTLPKEMQQANSLVPALQSNWLMMHVTIMILSYAALIFGSLLSIAFLVFHSINNLSSFSTSVVVNGIQTNEKKEIINESFNQILDNLSYRILGLGFPLLTIGILSGAVWANETWGSYWSWDPKETWALITWFIYAIYFHSRIIKSLKGFKPALIASIGFLSVWICYLGVNIFGKGLHSYGWFNFT